MFPVDLHTHTVASTHAYSTLREYIELAKQRGIKLFATTDHGPDMEDAPHYWHFCNFGPFPRILNGVGILRGIEANIKNLQGKIDCSKEMFEYLDIVLAGLHEPVFAPKDRQSHTIAMVNAMRRGRIDVITHPCNPAFPIDIETVVRAAVECQVALEVNNSSLTHSRPGSEGNCRRIIELARDSGCWLSCNSDAHSAYALGAVAEGEKLLRELGFPTERIINRSPRALDSFLKLRGRKSIPELATLYAAE